MVRRFASALGLVLVISLMVGFAPASSAVGAASGGTTSYAAGAAGHKVSMYRKAAKAVRKNKGGNARVAARKKLKRTADVRARGYENQIVRLTNAHRARVGCGRVTVNAALVRAARKHTRLMGQRRELSHQLAGERRLSARTTAAGYTPWRVVAENLAKGFLSPQDNFDAWVASPTHRANLDDCRLRHIGVSVQYVRGAAWVTQDFGVKR